MVQDNLLALEALTAFALEESNREFFKLEVDITATGRSDWGNQLRVNRTNFFNLQTYKVSTPSVSV